MFGRTLAAALVLATLASGANAQSNRVSQAPGGQITDNAGRVVGYMTARPDGRIEARNLNNQYLGMYDPKTKSTYAYNGQFVGRGDLLSAILAENTNMRSPQPDAGPRRAPHSGAGLQQRFDETQPQYQPQYQHRVMPSNPTGNRPLVSPETTARHARMIPSVSQEDRYFALDSLQTAAENIGRTVAWQNPMNGNSGTYTVSRESYETYVNGKAMTCYWALMTLTAAGLTDQQRQGVCKRPDNGVWTPAAVDVDYD